MKGFFFFLCFISFSAFCLAQQAYPAAAPLPKKNISIFGRGLYPGDDATYELLKKSGFKTLLLSSFYIHADGDLYSGDSHLPIIHNGKWVGDSAYVVRVKNLKKHSSISRIEILLEGRWYGQPPNTFDFIRDWYDPSKTVPGIVTGIGEQSTLFNICKVLKEVLGADAFCIDDESVYDSPSIIAMGKIAAKLNMHMTLCPFTKYSYWGDILRASDEKVVDALYLQCYDGGARNDIKDWVTALKPQQPIYPIFMVRGSFGTCDSYKGSKSVDEIRAQLKGFKSDYPAMSGASIWQMDDVKKFVSMGCAVKNPASGTATDVAQFLKQLKTTFKREL
ncbi:hypothetical protein MUY27_01470 [Mucilaginibacter sp. RS28]|uniref:Uncharacterized protein n=1 Tax=Mucilaginibacter straminoryzae TaxID=2932774 RepID=A0A9X1WZM2_9SPHI|nr:hypothetical protein [Mucilaginibacter straminoryzae]MCJ8208358.1 hypothetical protein [Mucilaginibacter straminoryzae]